MLDTAAAALAATSTRRARTIVVDLGVGSGALAARLVAQHDRLHIIGIDSDEGMLELARKRLGSRLTVLPGDFLDTDLPRCAAVAASFSLHPIPRRKLNADCCLASNPQLQRLDRAAWRRHLERRYTPRHAENLLRAWAKEDVYLSLEDEAALLREAGFNVDVPWRRHSFAVIVGVRNVRS